MFEFKEDDKSTVFVSLTDSDNPLSSFSASAFELDQARWPTVEHYFQAMKFNSSELRERIRTAPNPAAARQLARRYFWRMRFDWKRIRETVMTRATYIKCRSYPDIARALLDTGDNPIIEQSQYDYYWGRGRDGRGLNTYGKVLMNIRNRLAMVDRDESS